MDRSDAQSTPPTQSQRLPVPLTIELSAAVDPGRARSNNEDSVALDNDVALAVLAFGAVICIVNSILLVTISAYLQRIVPITIAWTSLFLLLGRLGDYMYRATQDERWRLLDPWRDMRLVGKLCFGIERESERVLAYEAVVILAALCTISLVALVRRVRAFDPFPGASSAVDGEVIKLWAAHVQADEADAPPGTVLEASPQGIVVATGRGRLVATELQRPGGKRLPAAEFLRGFELKAGQVFEN